MISRASLFALTASGALHAAVLSNWHAPLLVDPASIANFENNLDVQIIEDANTIGDIPAASQASIDSQLKSIPSVQVNEKEQALIYDVKHLSETIFSLKKQLENAHHEAQIANHEIEQLTSIKGSLEETLEAVHRSTNRAKASMSEEISALTAENRQSRAENADLHAQKNGTQSETTELRSANLLLSDLLSNARDSTQQSREELALEQAHSQALDHQLMALNNQQETLKTSLLNIQRETTILSEQKRELVVENTTLKTQQSVDAEAIQSLQNGNNDLSYMLDQTRQKVAELQATLEKSRETSQASLETGNAMDESNPTPAAGNPKPIYPKIAIRRGIEGDVSLRVMLTASGMVSSVTVEKPSGSKLLDAAAVSAVKQWQFNPAMHQGEPTASVTTVPIEFKLIQSRG
ncbi:MAG: TonB family protein [Proteobacteria bacterium]|nr:TonB family protein [Pseudomonadota bacterium]MBT7813747.1 TonB family protein [Pseudomonadota bacterium]